MSKIENNVCSTCRGVSRGCVHAKDCDACGGSGKVGFFELAERSGDEKFIAACKTGDLHHAVALVLFGDIPELKDSHTTKTVGKPFHLIAKRIILCATEGFDVEQMFEELKPLPGSITFNQAKVCAHRFATEFQRLCEFTGALGWGAR